MSAEIDEGIIEEEDERREKKTTERTMCERLDYYN